jgi:FkbM family methyltransferase
MRVVTLPNGMEAELPPNEKEALVLYKEIFETDSYLKHDIEVRDGDCVFDVGANVGLFSASLVQRYRDLRIILFEPLPDTFAMLERNAERLLGGARVTLVPAGVSFAPGEATFEFDTAWTAVAGASAFLRETEALRRSARREAGLLAWTRAAVDYRARAGILRASTARRLGAALSNPVSRPLALVGIFAFSSVTALKRRRRLRRITCNLTTISAAMREHGIDRVDLVKVDVEGAEWAVLQGIDAADWPRIRQLALEVHDVDGRVARMQELLEDKGYEVTVEQDDWRGLELQGIWMLYARR